jgi:hypothetical protein
VDPAAPAPATSSAATSAPATRAAAAQAQIPFANQGGIWNWQVVDDKTVLIQDRSRNWYKATLMVNCFNLPFAQRLGFETNPSGTFDKFSAIQFGDQRCPLISLVATPAPARKAKAQKINPAPGPQAPGASAPPLPTPTTTPQ